MASTVSWESLRELAGFRAEKGCAISVYVGLDPSVAPTQQDAQTRVRSLLDEGGKSDGASRTDLTHDQRQALKADFERIYRYFVEDFTRNGSRGVAVFAASLDNFWSPYPLAETVPDGVKVGRDLYLAPLVPLVGRGEGVLVCVVGRERGQLLRLRGGRLEEVADQFDEQPGRHDQGGWSQANYQRHIENLVGEHLRAVADELERRVRRARSQKVVVVGTDETRAEFEALLSPDVRACVIGWATADAHAGANELHETVKPVVEKWRIECEKELVDRWREGAGKNSRAVAGWKDTLEAASDARVDTLLFQEGVDHAGWQCSACGRVAADPGTCPLDGTTMDRSDAGLDLAIHQTLSNGGSVWAVQHHPDLGPVGGIGALLRF
jgi:peptide chain release factor subunit 1